MFVTAPDFDLYPYMIPGLSKIPSFQLFVDNMEVKYLKEVLGDNLYDAFINGLNELPNDYNPSVATVIGNQYVYLNDVWQAETVNTGVLPSDGIDWTLVEEGNRWLLLKNGNKYLKETKYYRWDGFKEAVKALIYSLWVQYGASELTSNGFVVPVSENSKRHSPMQRICDSWNDWSRRIGGKCETKNTLYGYLYYTNLNEGTFDDTFDETFNDFQEYLNYEFTEQSHLNVYGI